MDNDFIAHFPPGMPMDLARYTITPTTGEDVKAFFPRLAPFRIRAVTIRVDGTIYGIGGYTTLPNGQRRIKTI